MFRYNVTELVDEQTALATDRAPWEKYWRAIAAYVLPHTETFDRMYTNSPNKAVNSVVSTPVAANKSKDIYDMTSLWAIERLTAGMLSLKTPETEYWHDIGLDAYGSIDISHEEERALEELRNYLFRVRGNPDTNWWTAHRAAMRSMCAFGDGWLRSDEVIGGGRRVPYRFTYAPITELYPGVDENGKPNRMFRVHQMSALQLATKYPTTINDTVRMMANDAQQKHKNISVMQCIKPRDDADRTGMIGVRGARFASYYVLPEDRHPLGESGFYSFPYHRYAWNDTGNRPFSEGPVAHALGEIKSLNEMAKNELIAVQTSLRPAYATYGKNMVRLNFNPGASNPGLMTGDGKPLFQAINTGHRPDFAQAVLEARRNNLRELMYLNLWQIIIQDREQTATESLIRAQEKGELLGPVGISLNPGLSSIIDREVDILGRSGAFDQGSPLEMPESLADEEVTPIFTSPLDKLRRMGSMLGMQRLVEFGVALEQLKPGTAARFDPDAMLDDAQDILGAPASALRDKKVVDAERQQAEQNQQAAAMLEQAGVGGQAAKSVGEGAAALAQGAEMAGQSESLQGLLGAAPELGRRIQKAADDQRAA